MGFQNGIPVDRGRRDIYLSSRPYNCTRGTGGRSGPRPAKRGFEVVALDIQGVIVIKMDLYRIDALVEKEVIPEVLNELSCIEGRL